MNHIFKILLLWAALFITAISASADEIRTMLHRGHPVTDFVISYDERYLFTRSDGEICVWDLNTRMLVATLPVHATYICAHPADYRLLYVGTDARKVALSSDSSIGSCDIIDWTTGAKIGRVSINMKPKYYAGSDFTFVRQDDKLLMMSGNDMIPHTCVGTFGGSNLGIRSARTDATDSLLLTAGPQSQLWDLRHASLTGNIPVSDEAADGHFVGVTSDIMLGGKDRLTVLSPNGDKHEIPMAGAGNALSLSFSGETILAASNNGLFRSVEGKPFARLTAFRDASELDEITVVSRPYTGDRFLTGGAWLGGSGHSLAEGSFDTDAPLRFADRKYGFIHDIKISPHDDYAAVAWGNVRNSGIGLVSLKDLHHTAMLTAPLREWETVERCEILPDGTVVGGTSQGTLIFWRKGENRPYRQERVHHAEINSITLSSDSARMFTADEAGQITIWDAKAMQPLVYIYQTGDSAHSEYIFLTPDHYYKATPGISGHINFVKDNRPYAFEQFDLRNNRPDIVLSRLGGDPDEIDILRKAWKKRLRRAGIAEESLSADYHVPVTAIANRNAIPLLTADGAIDLDVTFSDSKFDLNEITVTLNGVPVLAPARRRVSGRTYRLNEKLELAAGNNEIAIWCTNSRGASSLRETLHVTYTPKAVRKPDLYIVAVGMSDYSDTRYNLGYAAKDAADFAAAMKSSAANRFGRIHQLVLTDSQFTGASLSQISQFLARAHRDDVAIVFYAGHGVLDSRLDYYLASHDIDFSDPAGKGVSYDDFIAVFESSPSVNRACFIDACHSGELDKEDYQAVNTVAVPEGEELLFRAAGQDVKAREDVERVNTILADMFVDTRWGVGATVLSSAGGGELAIESPEWKNGLFTYCLLKGLRADDADADRDGKTTMSEWIGYTRNMVAGMSEGRQSPTVRSQNYHNDLEIK